jgi:hypothetical protein
VQDVGLSLIMFGEFLAAVISHILHLHLVCFRARSLDSYRQTSFSSSASSITNRVSTASVLNHLIGLSLWSIQAKPSVVCFHWTSSQGLPLVSIHRVDYSITIQNYIVSSWAAALQKE